LNGLGHTNNQRIFGGIRDIIGGDFAQILPVIRRGTRPATVLACIRHASILANLHILKLRTSMRVISNDANQVFLTFLKDLVTNPLLDGHLQLPRYIHRVSTVDQPCDQLYPQPILNNAVNSH